MLRKVWHPHQGLWNWDLVMSLTDDVATTAPPKSKISWFLIYMDTLVLFIRIFCRRIRIGITSAAFPTFFKPRNAKVTYIDVGIHVAAKELALMRNHLLPSISNEFKCIGIEANESSFRKIEEKFQNDKLVQLINAAVCREVPESGCVKLYLHGDGHGDSMYRIGERATLVPAITLSDIVKKECADPDRIILVRMNIEGAEYDVLRDLRENGVLDKVDGFYGMWDDLSKIDPNLDREMISFMRENKIRTMTFNERDFVSEFRVKAISYDIITTVSYSSKC